MSDGNIGASINAYNTSLDISFGEVYEIDKGLPVGVIANPYSSTQTYAPGDYVIYKSKLYRCIVAIDEPEEFDSEKWVQVKVAEELKEKADKSSTYTKTETNALLDEKADTNSVYSKTEVDTALDDKMDKTNPVGTGSFSLNRREGSTIGTNSVAMGTNTVASGNNSFSVGYGSAANGTYSVAMGNGAAATGTSSNASGYSTTASGNSSHAEGYKTTASGTYSHAEGQESVSSGDYGSHAEGYKTTASGESSHSEGDRTESIGNNSHAEGILSSASGACSHAEGYSTTASKAQSHAEGYQTVASGNNSHAEGYKTTANGYNSHAEGDSTVASGHTSHAEGYRTTASENSSHAEGYETTASGAYSHAEGQNTTVSGNNSHAEGSFSTASGDCSHAEGLDTLASGDESHSEGFRTVANHKSQHVFGEYNVEDDSENEQYNRGNYVEIVGNGYWDSEEEEAVRSNARTLDWSGNEVLAGDLTYNGNKSLTSEISRLDGKIDNLPAPMIFKGTLGVGGTIQSLPTASASNEGWTYKVITDGTYAGQTAKVGDVFTSNGSEWVLIPAGDEDNDTWRAIKVNGVEKLGNGISSGAVDFEDTANVKFGFDANGNKISATLSGIYTSSEVNNLLDAKADKSDTYTKAQVDDIVYNILPDDTASGSVANFTTSLEMPIKSLEIDVNAVQASGTPTPATPLPISGWSEISLAQRGTNLWDEVWELGTINNQTGQNANDNNMYRSKNYIQVPKGENLYLFNGNSDTLGLRFYDSNKTFISARAFLTSKVMNYGTNDLPTGTAYIRFVNTSTNAYLNNVAINYPSSNNAYHAYNGNTEVINLGGTYYGGHFTQDKAGHRQFEVTHSVLTDLGSFTWNASSEGYTQSPIVPGMKKTESGSIIPDMFCNSLKVDTPLNVYNKVSDNSISIAFTTANSGLRVYMATLAGLNAAQVKSALSGIFIAYPLETPYVIDLPDGEPINTLAGVNNIYADTGDTSVVFKNSVNGYVEKKIASVQALALNT